MLFPHIICVKNIGYPRSRRFSRIGYPRGLKLNPTISIYEMKQLRKKKQTNEEAAIVINTLKKLKLKKVQFY